jgi:hypothetical protein
LTVQIAELVELKRLMIDGQQRLCLEISVWGQTNTIDIENVADEFFELLRNALLVARIFIPQGTIDDPKMSRFQADLKQTISPMFVVAHGGYFIHPEFAIFAVDLSEEAKFPPEQRWIRWAATWDEMQVLVEQWQSLNS